VGSVPSITNPAEIAPFRGEDLEACEAALGYQFRDKGLLRWCLTHASASKTRLESNERLEFLGDSIMGAVVCELLFEQFPTSAEGELTRIKSIVVSRTTCAVIARELGLERFLLVGRGVSSTSRTPGSILAAVLEALFGGIYLDGGFEAAREVIRKKLADKIESAAQSETGVNFKSLLQHLTQKNYGQTPVYQVLGEQGPDHSKSFQISAVINGEPYPSAWGPCKKIAEQRAAHNALSELDGKSIPYPLREPGDQLDDGDGEF
jgi:ribonuclease-3